MCHAVGWRFCSTLSSRARPSRVADFSPGPSRKNPIRRWIGGSLWLKSRCEHFGEEIFESCIETNPNLIVVQQVGWSLLQLVIMQIDTFILTLFIYVRNLMTFHIAQSFWDHKCHVNVRNAKWQTIYVQTIIWAVCSTG